MSDDLTVRSTPLVVCWDHTTFKVDVGFCVWCEVERLTAELAEIKNNALGLDDPDDEAILYGTPKACEIACRLWGEKDKRIEELESERLTAENEGLRDGLKLVAEYQPKDYKESARGHYCPYRSAIDGMQAIAARVLKETEVK